MRIGIAGSGAIALANAAWLAHDSHGGHAVTVWSPRGDGREFAAHAGDGVTLTATGLLQTEVRVAVAGTAATLAASADVLLIAVPVNGHRHVMDALLPHLRRGQSVIISAMGSLSALYLFEAARKRGLDITVASLGTTVLTARREGPSQVRIMTRRGALEVSALPQSRTAVAVQLCTALFGEGFSAQSNALATALSNINPVAHVPLALFNWTRIERAESWPQYHFMTLKVSAVIERLDAERLALARAFGLHLQSIQSHFTKSFATQSSLLANIAAELHAKRGGPPGPTDTQSRYMTEDVPYGLVFCTALGRMAGVPMPATQTMVDAASLIAGRDFNADNNLLAPLKIGSESATGLLSRTTG